MKLRLMTCSEVILLDSQTNTVSCINLIEELASPQFPILVPKFSILGLFEKEDGDANEATCDLTLNLNGQELVRTPLLINFQDKSLSRALVMLQGFVVPLPGTLTVSVVKDEIELGQWPVPIRQLEPEVEQAGG